MSRTVGAKNKPSFPSLPANKRPQPAEQGEGPTLRHSPEQMRMMDVLYGKELPQSHQDLVAMGGFNKEKTKR